MSREAAVIAMSFRNITMKIYPPDGEGFVRVEIDDTGRNSFFFIPLEKLEMMVAVARDGHIAMSDYHNPNVQRAKPE